MWAANVQVCRYYRGCLGFDCNKNKNSFAHMYVYKDKKGPAFSKEDYK